MLTKPSYDGPPTIVFKEYTFYCSIYSCEDIMIAIRFQNLFPQSKPPSVDVYYQTLLNTAIKIHSHNQSCQVCIFKKFGVQTSDVYMHTQVTYYATSHM